MNTGRPPLVLLGFGYVAEHLCRLVSPGRAVWATTRDASRVPRLESLGVRSCVVDEQGTALRGLPQGAEVVVSFPPDGHSDARFAALLPTPARCVYVSSTAVYPTRAGRIDDATEAAPDSPRGVLRLQAEQTWQALGAVVLRAPAIYGPGRGVLERLRAGTHRLVGDGQGRISRIHVEDLARCIVAALERGTPGATHVVADALPTSQNEIVRHICAVEGIALPAHVSPEDAPPTLTGDRAVDSRPAREALGVELRYPTYREGLVPLLRPVG